MLAYQTVTQLRICLAWFLHSATAKVTKSRSWPTGGGTGGPHEPRPPTFISGRARPRHF